MQNKLKNKMKLAMRSAAWRKMACAAARNKKPKAIPADPNESMDITEGPGEKTACERMRIIKYAMGYQRFYGHEGICIKKFEGTVWIQFENCTNVDIPEEFVAPCANWLRAKPLWSLKDKTRLEKQWVLEGCGIVSPTVDGLLEVVGPKQPAMLSTQHIDIWSTLVEATFQELHEDVWIWRMEPLRLMLELFDCEPRDAEGEKMYKKLVRLYCLK